MSVNSRGLTLLETLIAMGILATLMAFTAQTLSQALRTRARVQTQIDDLGQVRDALKIIEKDLNLAFNYYDIEPDFRTGVRQAAVRQMPPSFTQPNPLSPPNPLNPIPPGSSAEPIDPRQAQEDQLRRQNRSNPRTHFVATENSLYFFTLNRQGFFADELAPDFSRVSYQVKSCSGPAHADGKCWVRAADFKIFEGLETGFENEVILLDQIEELSLKFLPQGSTEWVKIWDSRSGQEERLNQFPQAVQVTVVRNRKGTRSNSNVSRSSVQMSLVARVSFPNNRPTRQNTLPQR